MISFQNPRQTTSQSTRFFSPPFVSLPNTRFSCNFATSSRSVVYKTKVAFSPFCPTFCLAKHAKSRLNTLPFATRSLSFRVSKGKESQLERCLTPRSSLHFLRSVPVVSPFRTLFRAKNRHNLCTK